MEDEIRQHVENLANLESEENVLQSLHKLKVLVESRSIEGERLVALIPPRVLFKRLLSNDKDVVKCCTVLLKMLLSFLKPELIIAEYEEAAVQGLNHPSEDVRELCLFQIERCVQTVSGLITAIHTSDLLNFVIRTLGDESMACAKVACNILVNVGKHQDGLKLLLDQTHQAEFEALMSKNDTVRFRVYELFVKIVESNHSIFAQVKPLFNKMAGEINSDDILVQMNCIELLTDVMNIGESGLNLSQELGVNKKLYDILKSPESNPISSLLIPAIVKFFGFLSVKKPRFVLENYPVFFEFVFNCIIANDDSLIGIALDTIGAIALSNEGLSVLFQTESQRNVMAKIGSCLQSAEEKLRIHCMDCLSSVFASDETSDKNTLDLIRILFLKLTSNPLELLFKILKQPFQNVRRSCFKTFYSLVSYQWMMEDIKNIPGFLEFLLDRTTESEKGCQELKYEVIKKMASSPFVSVVFDKPFVLKLWQFVRDGPFFAGSEVSVAMEGTQ